MSLANKTIENVNLTIATGQTNAVTSQVLDTRGDMDMVYGLSIVENNLAAITRYTVKVTDKTGGKTFLDKVNGKAIAIGTNGDIVGRFFPIQFPAGGNNYKITIETEGTTSGTFNVDVLFWEQGQTNPIKG